MNKATDYNLAKLCKSAFYSLLHPEIAFKNIKNNSKIRFFDSFVFVLLTIVVYHILHLLFTGEISSEVLRNITSVFNYTIIIVSYLVGFWIGLFFVIIIWSALVFELLKRYNLKVTFSKILIFTLYSCALLVFIPIFDIIHLFEIPMLQFPIEYVFPLTTTILKYRLFLHFSTVILVSVFFYRLIIFLKITGLKETKKAICLSFLIVLVTVWTEKTAEILLGSFHEFLVRFSGGIIIPALFDILIVIILALFASYLYLIYYKKSRY